MKRAKHPDRGYLYERINHNPLERSLVEAWESFNASRTTPILFDIVGHLPTRADRYAVASVVQWLGTNVGFSFLESAFRKVGYVILGSMPTKTYPPYHEEPLLQEISKCQAHQQWLGKIESAAKGADQLLFDLCEPN